MNLSKIIRKILHKQNKIWKRKKKSLIKAKREIKNYVNLLLEIKSRAPKALPFWFLFVGLFLFDVYVVAIFPSLFFFSILSMLSLLHYVWILLEHFTFIFCKRYNQARIRWISSRSITFIYFTGKCPCVILSLCVCVCLSFSLYFCLWEPGPTLVLRKYSVG